LQVIRHNAHLRLPLTVITAIRPWLCFGSTPEQLAAKQGLKFTANKLFAVIIGNVAFEETCSSVIKRRINVIKFRST
jgi:hypothetical protein